MNEPDAKRFRFNSTGSLCSTGGALFPNSASPDYQNPGSCDRTPPISRLGYPAPTVPRAPSASQTQESTNVRTIMKLKQQLELKELHIDFLEFLHKKALQVKIVDPTGKVCYPQWFVNIYVWAVNSVETCDTQICACLKELQYIVTSKDAIIRSASSSLSASGKPLTTIRTPTQNVVVSASRSSSMRSRKLKTTPFKNPNFEGESQDDAEWKTEEIKTIISDVKKTNFKSDDMNNLKNVVEDIVYLLASLRAACDSGDRSKIHSTTLIHPRNSEAHKELNDLAAQVYESQKEESK